MVSEPFVPDVSTPLNSSNTASTLRDVPARVVAIEPVPAPAHGRTRRVGEPAWFPDLREGEADPGDAGGGWREQAAAVGRVEEHEVR
jgi:hypothetical protein